MLCDPFNSLFATVQNKSILMLNYYRSVAVVWFTTTAYIRLESPLHFSIMEIRYSCFSLRSWLSSFFLNFIRWFLSFLELIFFSLYLHVSVSSLILIWFSESSLISSMKVNPLSLFPRTAEPGVNHDDVINGNIFRVTGHLWGEFTDPRWISLTKASDAEHWCFLWSAPEQTIE